MLDSSDSAYSEQVSTKTDPAFEELELLLEKYSQEFQSTVAKTTQLLSTSNLPTESSTALALLKRVKQCQGETSQLKEQLVLQKKSVDLQKYKDKEEEVEEAMEIKRRLAKELKRRENEIRENEKRAEELDREIEVERKRAEQNVFGIMSILSEGMEEAEGGEKREDAKKGKKASICVHLDSDEDTESQGSKENENRFRQVQVEISSCPLKEQQLLPTSDNLRKEEAVERISYVYSSKKHSNSKNYQMYLQKSK